jgi:hypothetical protein
MQAREHTNLLSIFAWIYAGLQGLFVVFFLLLVLLYGGIGVASAATFRSSDVAGIVFIAIFAMLFVAIAIFGIACMIANIQMGRRLRSQNPPTQKRMIATSILNSISWVCGGMFLMPFGIALAVYGFWFALSETGKAYLEGNPLAPAYAFPGDPQLYVINESGNRAGSPEPYRWQ